MYCSCQRPYPDPNRTSEEVMVQCIICEDWFHLDHLDDVQPNAAKLIGDCEMICHICMNLHKFLGSYTGLALNIVDKDIGSVSSEVNIAPTIVNAAEYNDNKLKSDLDRSISDIMNMGENQVGSKRKLSGNEGNFQKKQHLCTDPITPEIQCTKPIGATHYRKGEYSVKKFCHTQSAHLLTFFTYHSLKNIVKTPKKKSSLS